MGGAHCTTAKGTIEIYFCLKTTFTLASLEWGSPISVFHLRVVYFTALLSVSFMGITEFVFNIPGSWPPNVKCLLENMLCCSSTGMQEDTAAYSASHVCACGRLHLRRCNYQRGANGQPATTFRVTRLFAWRKYSSMAATVLPPTPFLSHKDEHTLSASRQFAFTTMPVVPDRSSSMLRVSLLCQFWKALLSRWDGEAAPLCLLSRLPSLLWRFTFWVC